MPNTKNNSKIHICQIIFEPKAKSHNTKLQKTFLRMCFEILGSWANFLWTVMIPLMLIFMISPRFLWPWSSFLAIFSMPKTSRKCFPKFCRLQNHLVAVMRCAKQWWVGQWGCLSHKFIGSVGSGRCWFVYQIHPPTIDTLVTGMTPVRMWDVTCLWGANYKNGETLRTLARTVSWPIPGTRVSMVGGWIW